MKHVVVVAVIALATMPALAAPHGPGKPLPGWQCMSLDATEAQMMDRTWPGVAILAEPDPGSRKLGIASAIPFVANPPILQNGYLRTLRLNGQVGWIRAQDVKPYHSVSNPYAVCRVLQYEDGSVGSGGL